METVILLSLALPCLVLLFGLGLILGKLHGQTQERLRVRDILNTATSITDRAKVIYAKDIERIVCSGLPVSDSDARDFIRRHSIVKSERTTRGMQTPDDYGKLPYPYLSKEKCIVCGLQHGIGMPCPSMHATSFTDEHNEYSN